RPTVAEQLSNGCDDGCRYDDLEHAQSEHQATHGEQALEGELKADEEHQEHDAEFGDAGDTLGVRDGDPVEKRGGSLQRTEAVGSKQSPGSEIAQHWAHA